MTRLTISKLEEEGFGSGEEGLVRWEEEGEVLLSLEYSEDGWLVYPHDCGESVWPKFVNYWEELAPILAAVRVGY